MTRLLVLTFCNWCTKIIESIKLYVTNEDADSIDSRFATALTLALANSARVLQTAEAPQARA